MYLVLRRMVQHGLIEPVSGPAGHDARRQYYRSTDLGRQAVTAELAQLSGVLGVALRKKLAPFS